MVSYPETSIGQTRLEFMCSSPLVSSVSLSRSLGHERTTGRRKKLGARLVKLPEGGLPYETDGDARRKF